MTQLPARGLGALAMTLCAVVGVARAADPIIPPETRFVAASSAAPATTLPFSIATSTDLVVTLTDQNFPVALVSGGFVVTQGGTVAGSATFVAPTSGSGVAPPAVASIPAAVGKYTLYVFGVPGTGGVGTFSACVAPKASPSNCIQSASIAGTIALPAVADPTVADTVTTLTVTTADMYTFNFGDLQFPVALSTPPNLALFQGSQPVIPTGQSTPAIISGTKLQLSPGAYQLFAIAQADPNVKAGLYSVNVSGTSGGTLLSQAFPVGMTSAAPVDASLNLSSSQSVTLTVADYGFPAMLTSASALLTAGSTVVATANATGGPQTGMAPTGQLYLWTYGNPSAGAGTYSADVSSGATDLYTIAKGVSSGTTFAYAFVPPKHTNPLPAGAYKATAADLQFPAQLTGLSFAVAENGLILQKSAGAGTIDFNVPAAGNVIVLASAQPPASGSTSASGLFDVNLQSTGASANLIYDQTQIVSSTHSLFDSQTLTIGVDASFDATLTDLKVPAAFDTLSLLVSRGSTVLGKIYGGGTFSFPASAGTYLLTFVATPSAMQNFGAYATSVVFSAPIVTLTASAASVSTGGIVTLNWSATNATSCTASGGTFTGTQPTSTTSLAVVVSATTTYMLSCTGAGGNTSQSVTVTATQPKASGGGGGSVDPAWLMFGSWLMISQLHRRQSRAPRA